jgi:hypothetical protein
MMNLDIIPEGWHKLSGFCDCEIKDEYNNDMINGLIIQLDGKNYQCYEDPSDGYRSYSEVQETDKACANTFPPQRVMVKHYDRNSNHGIEVFNPDFELILRVGTDDYDDYYPIAVWEWHPENLPINKGVHKKEYDGLTDTILNMTDDKRGKDPNMILGIDLNIDNPDYTSLSVIDMKGNPLVYGIIPCDCPNAYFWMKALFEEQDKGNNDNT